MPKPPHTRAPAPPPGWRTTSEPLRIAILGWARLALQAREGSGYNLNASELAAGLALTGHHVFYLASGMRYSLRPGMRIRPRETWRGVRCFDLINSPNLSPSALNFRNVKRERSAPAQSRLVVRWLRSVGAQIVHVHALEGYGLDLIGAIRDAGLPVVVTPHNYWYVCPQVDLLWRETVVCDDYDGGRRCVGCLTPRHPSAQRLRRAVGQTADTLLGPHGSRVFRTAVDSCKRMLASLRTRSPSIPTDPPPDPDLALGFDMPADGADGRVGPQLPLLPHESPPEPGRSPPDANEAFLAPPADGAPDRHLTVLNAYGRRRLDGVAALERASLVTPPSAFVGAVYRRMGLPPQRVRVVRLGQPHFDRIHRRVRQSPYYDRVPWTPDAPRPLRFAFLGTTRHNKGLEVLVRAITRLEPDVRTRCQFLIRAAGWDWPFRKRLCTYPEVQFAGGYDTLQLMGAVGEYDVGLLPHIWFENSPLVMLEHLHAGKFVIAARLGGPVEWIREGVNGLLFPGGDDGALARCISRVVTGRCPLPSPRQIHQNTPHLTSYPRHVEEVESIYRLLLRNDQAPASEVESKASITSPDEVSTSDTRTADGSTPSISDAAVR